MGLQELAVVHQQSHLESGGRKVFSSHDAVDGFGGGQMVADRADPTEPLDEDRYFPERAALDKPLETSKLYDVKASLPDPVLFVQKNSDLSVALDAGHRLYDDLPGCIGSVHDPSPEAQSYLMSW